jgi:hypothetical protein
MRNSFRRPISLDYSYKFLKLYIDILEKKEENQEFIKNSLGLEIIRFIS